MLFFELFSYYWDFVCKLSIYIFIYFIWPSNVSFAFCTLYSNFFWFFIKSSSWICALESFLLWSFIPYLIYSRHNLTVLISTCKLFISLYNYVCIPLIVLNASILCVDLSVAGIFYNFYILSSETLRTDFA